LQKLIQGENIVKYIETQLIKWWGYFNRLEDTKLVKRNTDWNRIGIRTKGRPKNRWRDEVINNVKKLRMRKCFQLVKDREQPGMILCRRPITV
jgi:hypothetical protein